MPVFQVFPVRYRYFLPRFGEQAQKRHARAFLPEIDEKGISGKRGNALHRARQPVDQLSHGAGEHRAVLSGGNGGCEAVAAAREPAVLFVRVVQEAQTELPRYPFEVTAAERPALARKNAFAAGKHDFPAAFRLEEQPRGRGLVALRGDARVPHAHGEVIISPAHMGREVYLVEDLIVLEVRVLVGIDEGAVYVQRVIAVAGNAEHRLFSLSALQRRIEFAVGIVFRLRGIPDPLAFVKHMLSGRAGLPPEYSIFYCTAYSRKGQRNPLRILE